MANKKETGITITEIRGWLPFLAILVSIILAWSSLSFQNTANADNINAAKEDIRDLKMQQKAMNDQLIRIATIIETAQKNGQLTFNNHEGTTLAFAKTISITITPTPNPTPIPTEAPHEVNHVPNQAFAQTPPNSAGQSANINPITPTPSPQPTPQPTGLQQVLNAVGSIIGMQ